MHEITGHKIIRDSPKPSSAGQRMLTEQCLIFHFIKREGNKEKTIKDFISVRKYEHQMKASNWPEGEFITERRKGFARRRFPFGRVWVEPIDRTCRRLRLRLEEVLRRWTSKPLSTLKLRRWRFSRFSDAANASTTSATSVWTAPPARKKPSPWRWTRRWRWWTNSTRGRLRGRTASEAGGTSPESWKGEILI